MISLRTSGLLCEPSLLYGTLGLDAVGDVRCHHQRVAGRLFDLGGEVVQAVLATGDQRDGGTEPASWRAAAAPMPLLAPVTRAAVLVSFDSIGFVLSKGTAGARRAFLRCSTRDDGGRRRFALVDGTE